MGTSKSEWTATERIFDMMKYLCRVRYASMPELAKIYDVSVRTIKRDIDVLGALIPLKIKYGRYEGGVYVMDDYRWDKHYMNGEDIELLIKIKLIGEKREVLILTQEELERLVKIISVYSHPKQNYLGMIS